MAQTLTEFQNEFNAIKQAVKKDNQTLIKMESNMKARVDLVYSGADELGRRFQALAAKSP